MFISTRNFFLYLLSVAFLVIAITYTISSEGADKTDYSLAPVDSTLSTEVVYQAETGRKNELDRVAKVSALRQKINELGATETIKAPEVAEAENTEEVVEEVAAEEELKSGGLLLCSNFTSNTPLWPRQGVKISVVEGARLIFTEQVITSNATGSLAAEFSSKEVLLQLPLAALPGANTNCLKSDVVGVALDGSLMRNTEKALYGIFAADTLLGYALDGFPIYGQNEAKTDTCGGVVVAGQYRYYIANDRETLINCFAGLPTSW